MKVQITMPDELLQKMDQIADSMYLSRSTFITFAVSQYIATQSVQNTLTDLYQILEKYKSDDKAISEMDDSELLELNDILSTYKNLIRK